MARGRSNRTPKNRETLVAALREGLSVGGSCVVAGISRRSYYDWRAEDPEFAAECDEAMDAGTDFLEDVARQRATESSDTLLIFLLKARRPEKYRETHKHELSGRIDSALTVVIGERQDGPQ